MLDAPSGGGTRPHARSFPPIPPPHPFPCARRRPLRTPCFAAARTLAAGPGSRPAARCRDAQGRHDARLRRHRCRGRLALEGCLRGRRSRGRAVRAALRARHAQADRGRAGRPALHVGNAGRRRGTRAVAHEALRGADPPAAVLDPAAAGLCRAPRRRHPAGRYRAGAERRHRHAGGDSRMRDGQPGRGQSVSQRIRPHARASPDPSVPPGRHHRLQCGSPRRPASRCPAHGRHHEPAVSPRPRASTASATTPIYAISARHFRCCRREADW